MKDTRLMVCRYWCSGAGGGDPDQVQLPVAGPCLLLQLQEAAPVRPGQVHQATQPRQPGTRGQQQPHLGTVA